MAIYRIAVRTTATGAVANAAAAAVWNPSTTRTIRLREIWVASTTAGLSNLGLLRITARGTATALVAALQQADGREVAAPSLFAIDTAASVQPTLDVATAYQWRWNLPASIGAGVIAVFSPSGILIPVGAGIALVTPPAVILPVSDVTFVVED